MREQLKGVSFLLLLTLLCATPVLAGHISVTPLGTTEYALGDGSVESAPDVSSAGYLLTYDNGNVTSADVKVINNRSNPIDVEVTIALKNGSTTVESGSKTFPVDAKTTNSVTIVFSNTRVRSFDTVEVATTVVN